MASDEADEAFGRLCEEVRHAVQGSRGGRSGASRHNMAHTSVLTKQVACALANRPFEAAQNGDGKDAHRWRRTLAQLADQAMCHAPVVDALAELGLLVPSEEERARNELERVFAAVQLECEQLGPELRTLRGLCKVVLAAIARTRGFADSGPAAVACSLAFRCLSQSWVHTHFNEMKRNRLNDLACSLCGHDLDWLSRRSEPQGFFNVNQVRAALIAPERAPSCAQLSALARRSWRKRSRT